jgi:hypothetical protein
MLRFGRLLHLFAALVLSPFGTCFAEGSLATLAPPSQSEKQFLGRLMAAESGARLNARNPASSALGSFQFLRATFLDIIRRNFPALSESKSEAEILALRMDTEVAWNAALIYTRENAHFLAEHGAAISAANLRLAFLVGPSAALKILAAKPEEPLTKILSAAALEVNPFLGHMTAGALIERSSWEMGGGGGTFNASAPPFKAAARQFKSALLHGTPKIAVLCNLNLPSCRKWLALAEGRAHVQEARLVRQSAPR